MAEKQKPEPGLVRAAARGLKHPDTVSMRFIQGAMGRILDDQKNDPNPHRIVLRGRRKTRRDRKRS